MAQEVGRQRHGGAVRADVRTPGTGAPGHGVFATQYLFSRQVVTCFILLSLYSIMSVLAMGWPG